MHLAQRSTFALALAASALLASTSAGAVAPALAGDGAWSGRTSQGLGVTLTIRDHDVVALTVALRRTPFASGIPTSACRATKIGGRISPRDHSDTYTTHKTFGLASDPEWQITGRIQSPSRIVGRIEYTGDGSVDPCQATVSFVAHPR